MKDTTKNPEKNFTNKDLAEKKLLDKGKKNGLLTYKEIMDTLEAVDLDPEEIDEIYQRIEDSDIDIMGEKDEEILLADDDDDDEDSDEDIDTLSGCI